MADIEALNAVAAANIEAVNGVAKANIETINGVGIGGLVAAAYWVVGFHGSKTSWAAAADIADVTVWEANKWTTHGDGGSTAIIDVAYGKDSSGNPIFVAIANSTGNNTWVDGNNDITDDSSWTRIQLPTGERIQRETIQWGNDVWVAAGRVTTTDVVDIHRSTNGITSWSTVDVSGLTNITDDPDFDITALASDGAGNWMFGQKENLYFSSDDAASWAFLVQPAGTGHEIRDIVFTNNTWVVLFDGDYHDNSDPNDATPDGIPDQDAYVITCPASTSANMDATGDWGTAQKLEAVNLVDAAGNSTTPTTHLNGVTTRRMAAAGGRVVFLQCGAVPNGRTLAADVSGKTCTLEDTVVILPFTEGNVNCIATDGITWLVGGDGGNTAADGGEICRSTDGGDTWTLIVNAIQSATYKVEGIAPSVYLPL